MTITTPDETPSASSPLQLNFFPVKLPARPLFSALCALLVAAPPARAADARADFLNLIDRPRVPLAAEIKPAGPAGAIAGAPAEFHFSFAADARQRVPGLLLKPAGATGRLPVVIALHVAPAEKGGRARRSLRALVARGFIGIAIDGRYHGERAAAGQTGSVSYQAAILRAWEGSGEHPFFYDGAWDVMRLVDWLETRDDVDAKRIGLYGVSKGGIETYFAAAADPRIAVAVPCISVEELPLGDRPQHLAGAH